MRASYIAYRKVGEHRGGKRIWLQGNSLDDAGFSIGDEYNTKIEPDKITLTITDTGDRKVARKKITGKDEYQPVVDLSNQLIANFFKKFDRCKISFYSHGLIVISYHPTDKKITERLTKFYQAIKTRMVKTASLSHGGGIMSTALHEGLKKSGFETDLQFAIELEEKYLKSSLNNSPIWSGNSIAIEGLMEDDELELLDDVVLFEAGLPCTGASISGRSKNKLKFAEQHESAGRLFYSFLSQIQKTNPSVIVLENVKQYANTISFHVIQDVLDGWGYEIGEVQILNGQTFGAIENRDRMFMVGVSKGIEFDWSNVFNYIPDKPFNNIGDLLDPISDTDPMWSEMKGLKHKQESDIKKGKGFMMQIVNSSSTKSAVIGKGYSKIRSTEPKIENPSNPDLLRQLTPNEHSRAKTIPEYLIKGNTNTTAHEILGQSVIYNVVKSIGQTIGDCFLSYEEEALKAA